MTSHQSFDTATGSIDVTRVGPEYDLNVRNLSGDTILTIRVSHSRLIQLRDDAAAELSLARF